MALKNTQYYEIMKQYEERQSHNHFQMEKRQQEIRLHIPEYEELRLNMLSLCLERTKASLGASFDRSPAELEKEIERISKKKQNLLIQAGYEPDYLEPIYTCPDCRDTGYIDGKECHCFREAIADVLYHQSSLRPVLEKENFDTFCLDLYDRTFVDSQLGKTPYQNMMEILKKCHSFIDHFDRTDFWESPHNLLFVGQTGVGKSFLSHCITKELLQKGHMVLYLSAVELTELFEQNKFSKDTSEDKKEQYDDLFSCDLLVIDDLGTETITSFTISALLDCINRREASRHATIISSNYNPFELQKLYSERFSSRILANYQLLPIIGEDIRIRQL